MASELFLVQEEVQLPGELPKALRYKRCSFRPAPADFNNLSLQRPSPDSGASSYTVQGWSRGEESSQDFNQGGSNGDTRGDENGPILKYENSADDDPLKVLRRLDNIIDRLLSSCSERPDVSLPPTDDHRRENPPNDRELEEHLDNIIKMLSQRGHFGRCDGEKLLVTPVAAKPNEGERAGSSPTPNSLSRKSSVTPITPRSLLTRSSSAEKHDLLASPPAARSLSRSGRFATALSFLSSPRRAGFSSLRIGSPSSHRTQDEQENNLTTVRTPDQIKI